MKGGAWCGGSDGCGVVGVVSNFWGDVLGVGVLAAWLRGTEGRLSS